MKHLVSILSLLLSNVAFAQQEPPADVRVNFPNVAQLVWVKLPTTATSLTTAQLWEIKNGEWVKLRQFDVVVGVNGTAKNKREGDGKSPEGLFPFIRTFGKGPAPEGLKMDYNSLQATDKWIDDQNHADYNRWVRGNTTATSFENLLRTDGQYDFFAVVGYNMFPVVKGRGSAIFMHVWVERGHGTAGCVAMAREDINEVAKVLDPEKYPHILIGNSL